MLQEWYQYIPLFVLVPSALVMTTYLVASLLSSGKKISRHDDRVSILIAARNEEENILPCLQALALLDYPNEKLEILIGDDDSEDETASIIHDFIKDKPHFRYFRITKKLEGLHGKQNVLAQLAHHSIGDFLFVTDADVIVHPKWVDTLLSAFAPATGMVSGVTLVEGRGFFANMQSLDWLFGMAVNDVHATIGIPISGVGNNMAIRRKAYFDTGGYEKIPFSITEDYKLFQAIVEKGNYKFRNVFCKEGLNKTHPLKTFGQLVQQRRRWFKGGRELAWYNLAAMFLNTLVVPSLISAVFLLPFQWFLIFYCIKVAGDFLFLLLSAIKTGKMKLLLWFPLYQIYYQLTSVLWTLNQFIPSRVVWKGRTY